MRSAQAIPVLMYHHVSPAPGLVTVSSETFGAQMTRLAETGYTSLTADQFAAFLEGRANMPPKSVLITFDDGYLDNYVYAFPVLQRLGLHAVIFAVTGWVGEGPTRPHAGTGETLPACPNHRDCKTAIAEGRADEVMMRWSEIQAMEATGAVEIQSHTHSHIRWDREISDPSERIAAVGADLARSREMLRARLGGARDHLCWPWGYFEPGYQQTAKTLGFRTQFSTRKRVSTRLSPADDIGRIVIKDRGGSWLPSRLWIYSRPWFGALYVALRGE